jgi:hypothetical protein
VDGQAVPGGPAEYLKDRAVGDAAMAVQRGHPVDGRIGRAGGPNPGQGQTTAGSGRGGPWHSRRRCR